MDEVDLNFDNGIVLNVDNERLIFQKMESMSFPSRVNLSNELNIQIVVLFCWNRVL